MIGLHNAFATLRRIVMPPFAKTEEQFLEVLVSPSLVQWDFVPFDSQTLRIIRSEYNGPAVYAIESGSQADMLWQFVRDNLPRQEQACTVLDEAGRALLGWWHDGNGVRWFGCQWAFDMLAVLADPMDVAVWEMSAREEHDRFTSLERMHRDQQ